MPSSEQRLRHVVLFGFSPDTSATQEREVVDRFAALGNQVPGVEAFEWGLNTSPELLSPELSHCFVLTFRTEAARDAYLVDPAHVAFADWVDSWVQHVTVVDFWADTGN